MLAAQRVHGLAQARQARRLARGVGGGVAAFPFVPDVGAGAGARRQETLGGQLVEGIEDGDPRQLQLLAQGAGGGQARAARQAPGEDLLAHLQVELAVERHGTGAVQLDTGQQHAAGRFHSVSASLCRALLGFRCGCLLCVSPAGKVTGFIRIWETTSCGRGTASTR
ncbi:hypothetical protein D9M71_571390 [compost metagenome]